MHTIFQIKRLKADLENWVKLANERIEKFTRVYNANEADILGLNVKILNSFTYAFYKRVSGKDREQLWNAVRNNELSGIIAIKFKEVDRLPSYGPMNPFVALRIYYRKIEALVKKTSEAKKQIRDIFKQLKEIDMKAREFEAAGHKSDDLFDIRMNILAFQQKVKELVDLEANSNKIDFMIYIRALIESVKTIKRDDLLQVITLNKDRRNWGEPVTPFSQVLKEIPEEIDWDEFQNLIFVESIERPGDDYLARLFMDHVFMVRDQIEAETGEKPFDAFEIMEEITGKPVQTFTAEFDEYGDVVNMIPNKPNLKVVDGGRDQTIVN